MPRERGARARSHRFAAALFVAPAALLALTLTVVPLLTVIAISFTDWRLGAARARFTGFANYLALLEDGNPLRALANTALYVSMTVPLSLAIGLGVALLVRDVRRGRSFYQLAFFLPNIAIFAATVVVWEIVLHPGIGPVGRAFLALGLESPNWIKDERFALATIALIGIWRGLGFCMVFYLAGLTGIDRTLYDAALVDGARTAWDRFWIVTWPELAPTSLFLLVVSTVHAFQVFEPVAILTQGGPQGATQVLLHAIYQEGFGFLRAGQAAALSVAFLVLLGGLAVVQVKLIERKVSYR